MFRQINSIFRKKDNLDIPNLIIEKTRTKLMQDANIDINTVQKDSNGNFVITEEGQKLDILCVTFAAANVQIKI